MAELLEGTLNMLTISSPANDGSEKAVVNKECWHNAREKNACSENENDKEKGVSTDLSKACFICQEKGLVNGNMDCKVCHNINLYRSKNEVQRNDDDEQTFEDNVDDKVDLSFPEPGIIKRNHIYGNYVVASRTIEAGELIISERPLTIGPYAPTDVLPLCLSCCKDIGLSSKCSKCRWPICGEKCEKFYLHADNECSIFAGNKVKSSVDDLKEYFCVETLRALLLRRRNHEAWHRIMQFEPHVQARSTDFKAKETTDFIIDFIRNKCALGDEFTSDEIDHVVGVLSVNTFWTFNDLKIYSSCLFDKITLFAHDCDPNTTRQLILEGTCDENCNTKFPDGDPERISRITLQVTANQTIQAGEMISTRYIKLDQTLAKRREELKETFYFDCTCSRCLREMLEVGSEIDILKQ